MLNTNNINFNNNSNGETYTPKRSYIPSPFPKSFFENSTKTDEFVKTPINAHSINNVERNYIPSPYRQVKTYQEYVLQTSQNAINNAISLMNGGI